MSTLLIYKRRHDDDCLAKLAKKGTISSADPKLLTPVEKKMLTQYRGRDCACVYWVRGVTDNGVLIEDKSLKVRTAEAAELKVRELNAPPVNAKVSVSLAGALAEWQKELKASNVAAGTLVQYTLSIQSAIDILAGLGITELGAVEPSHVNDVRASWESHYKHNTRRSRETWLRTFFRFCLRMDFISKDPMSKVARLRKSRSEDDAEEATLPLDVDGTDTNYRKILAAIPEYFAGRIGEPHRVFDTPIGKRAGHMVAYLELMYETGLRRSDAIMFQPDKMIFSEDGSVEYTTRQIKSNKIVTVYPPLWLAEKLRALPKLSARYLFIDDAGLRQGLVGYLSPLYSYLKKSAATVGILGVRPHRFRDSFAVNRLNEGLEMGEVSKLLGHSGIAMTERYYAPFVKSRQDRLRGRVLAARAQAEAAATKSNVITINKKRRAS